MNTRLSAVFPLTDAPAQLTRWMAGFVVLAALLFAPHIQAATPGGASDQPVVQQLLDAMAKSDYEGFTRQGTPQFAAIDQAQFTQVATSIAPRLQKGYAVEYLGNLKQQGLDISIWKVSFQDQGDDLLATLNVQNGQVGGFFLR